MKVATVVVTYNRQALLAKTLAAIEAQTRPVDRLYVVNNASTDQTEAYLRARRFSRPTTVATLPSNSGGAGGFASGLSKALTDGYDWVWLMDDDTVPSTSALAELLKQIESYRQYSGNYPSFACSLVKWTDGSLCEMNTPTTTWDWPRGMVAGHNWQLVNSCSFVSCLVEAKAVHRVGLPYREYFIWADDLEYTLRLARLRPGILAPKSVCEHLLARNRGVNWGDVTPDNLWKFKYGARNQVSAAISAKSLPLLADLAQNMIRQFTGSKVPLRLRAQIWGSALGGVFFRPPRRCPQAGPGTKTISDEPVPKHP